MNEELLELLQAVLADEPGGASLPAMLPGGAVGLPEQLQPNASSTAGPQRPGVDPQQDGAVSPQQGAPRHEIELPESIPAPDMPSLPESLSSPSPSGQLTGAALPGAPPAPEVPSPFQDLRFPGATQRDDEPFAPAWSTAPELPPGLSIPGQGLLPPGSGTTRLPEHGEGPGGMMGLLHRMATGIERLHSPSGGDPTSRPQVGGPQFLPPLGGMPSIGLAEGYSAASPSMNLSSFAGQGGAGGWDHGSGYGWAKTVDFVRPSSRPPGGEEA